jgi:hypothetical protein
MLESPITKKEKRFIVRYVGIDGLWYGLGVDSLGQEVMGISVDNLPLKVFTKQELTGDYVEPLDEFDDVKVGETVAARDPLPNEIKMKARRQLVLHHYYAFNVKPDGVRCKECRVKLDKLECIQVTTKGSTSGLWYCWDHQPFEPVTKD